MQKITTFEQLKKEILLLEVRQAHERALLKEQFHITYQSFKPANMIKNALKDIVNTPDIRSGVLGSVVSMAAGYLSKKAIVGPAPGVLRSLLGGALQLIVTKVVAKKAKDMGDAQADKDAAEESEEYNDLYTSQSELRN